MQLVVLAYETDWGGWRKAVRSLVLAGAAPEDVRWTVGTYEVRSSEEATHLPAENESTFVVGPDSAIEILADGTIVVEMPPLQPNR